MTHAVPFAEITRGAFIETVHLGQAVICDSSGRVVETWGDPDAVILPRSAIKMIQALPLVASGAADASGLGPEHLALACASHSGAAIHTGRVRAWLGALGLGDDDLRCGPQVPSDPEARHAIRCEGAPACQVHNNCSGKHAGMLTLTRHLRAGPEYHEADHPVQRACLEAFERVTGETSPGYGIDGCSLPNHAATLGGVARAMGWFAGAAGRQDAESRAAARLVRAMMAHPELVAGEGRACTELMRAARGRAALKTGAEGVFTAILPELGLGIALKIADGATRASECAIAALLVRLGVLEAEDPAVRRRRTVPILNRRGLQTGEIRPAAALG
ncbi:MAG: asparaginase [Paracoccaceae bacterium]